MEARVVPVRVARRAACWTDEDFERIYELYKNRVYSTACRMVSNRTDAEDITQDVFVRVYKKLGSFRGEAELSTWIYRITMNCCLDYLRRRKRDLGVQFPPDFDAPGPGIDIINLIEGALPSMPQGYRQVFVLHDLQGMKHSEIAEILGIAEGASKSQLHRARAFLRRTIGPWLKAMKR
ncbi:MAG: RNA polymerase sigma factor [candidate division WOR-3 bacterium]